MGTTGRAPTRGPCAQPGRAPGAGKGRGGLPGQRVEKGLRETPQPWTAPCRVGVGCVGGLGASGGSTGRDPPRAARDPRSSTGGWTWLSARQACCSSWVAAGAMALGLSCPRCPRHLRGAWERHWPGRTPRCGWALFTPASRALALPPPRPLPENPRNLAAPEGVQLPREGPPALAASPRLSQDPGRGCSSAELPRLSLGSRQQRSAAAQSFLGSSQ